MLGIRKRRLGFGKSCVRRLLDVERGPPGGYKKRCRVGCGSLGKLQAAKQKQVEADPELLLVAKHKDSIQIYGGGFFNGGSLDPRYNMSFIVQQSVAINKPMIGVSINYRLQGLGMLFSQEILEEGVANLGFKDQRLALHWIQENIAAFGGDPSKVTIWGESAGAGSVGLQLTAFGGRDDRLFRGAIQQSGGHVDTAPLRSAPDWQPFYDNITTAVNCSASADSLACLRTVPIETLAAVLNSSVTAGVRGWGASVDSDFLLAASNSLTLSGRFVRVPLLHGRNHDEGTMFATRGLNTTEQFLANIVSRGFSNATAQTLAILYPDIPAIGIPPTLNGRPIGPDGSLGVQWKRASAFTGDLSMHAPRRLLSQTYARYNVTSYSYHFNVLVNGIATTMGATHFQEVVFVFNNTEGLGYDTAVAKNPFENAPEALLQLAAIMSRMWVSFIVDGDPNTGSGKFLVSAHRVFGSLAYLHVSLSRYRARVAGLHTGKPSEHAV